MGELSSWIEMAQKIGSRRHVSQFVIVHGETKRSLECEPSSRIHKACRLLHTFLTAIMLWLDVLSAAVCLATFYKLRLIVAFCISRFVIF